MRDANRREFGRQTFPRARARRLIDDRSQSKPRDARDEDAVAADEGRRGGSDPVPIAADARDRPSTGAETARGNPTAADGSAAPTAAETCAAWAEMCAPPGTSARAAEVNAGRTPAGRRRRRLRIGTLVDGALVALDGGEQITRQRRRASHTSGAMVTASRSGVVAATASPRTSRRGSPSSTRLSSPGPPRQGPPPRTASSHPGVVLAVASLASRIARATSAWCSAIGSKPAQSGTTTIGGRRRVPRRRTPSRPRGRGRRAPVEVLQQNLQVLQSHVRDVVRGRGRRTRTR